MKNSDQLLRVVRELKGAPLSIWFVLQIVRQPCKQEYLERKSGYTDKPVSQALQYLKEIGLVVYLPLAGWMLSSQAPRLSGLDLLMPADPESQLNHEPRTVHDSAATDVVEAAPEDVKEPVAEPNIRKSRNISDSVCDDGIKTPGIDSHHHHMAPPSRRNSDSAALGTGPIDETQAKTRLLLSAGVWQKITKRIADRADLRLADVIAKLDELYNPRNGWKRPERLVAHLLDGEFASPAYYEQPGHFIPRDILERAGLVQEDPRPVEPEIPAEIPEEIFEADPDPALTAMLPNGSRSPWEAWRDTLAQLEAEMPKAAFNTWVRQTRLAAYEADQATFVVAAGNAYARDWLDSRLTSTCRRLLVGSCNMPVDIRFIVGEAAA